jgi:hypothetical protein
LTSEQLDSASTPSSKSTRKTGFTTRQRRRVVFLNVRELPVKFRTKLEEAWDCEVIDRFSLILQIFSQRAKTRFVFPNFSNLSPSLQCCSIRVDLNCLCQSFESKIISTWLLDSSTLSFAISLSSLSESQLSVELAALTYQRSHLIASSAGYDQQRGGMAAMCTMHLLD